MRIVIVGGGLVGSATAWALREAGCDVVVLERAVPGAEASHAAAGILAPLAECDRPGPFLDLCRLGLSSTIAWHERLRERTGLHTGLRQTGTIDVAFDEDEESRLRARVAWQQQAGLPSSWLDASSLRARLPGLHPDARGAASFATEAHLDPRSFFEVLSTAVRASGVVVRSGRRIERIEPDRRRVHLEGGDTVDGDAVVVCAGAWTTQLAGMPLPDDAVVPVRGQIAEMRTPAPGAFDVVVYGRGGYLVPRPDGRVVVGSTAERVGFDKSVTVQGLHRVLDRAQQLMPALANAAVSSTWAGLRPGTRDGLPLLGELQPGLWVASGHFRNGVLLATASAEIVRDALVHGPQEAARISGVELQPFSPRRFVPAR